MHPLSIGQNAVEIEQQRVELGMVRAWGEFRGDQDIIIS
jgi:hypothetical protein